ncbi:hypothetical protein KGF57_002267 [Candida theae]|uniref:JmjC domain-containing protein n=1 Tax=Candida theae TaxID=1198502 RepID=A0AAD5BFR8_9ASCO|nr:uncharacterized protein KGF57_002267 [Candida theae]KAI5958833.1 hypothetical protein KGF57_002267 [Candida theae]
MIKDSIHHIGDIQTDQPALKKVKTDPSVQKKHTYPSPSRTISILSIANKQHPLNVKPSGNTFIAIDSDILTKGQQLLGDLNRFPYDVILHIISYIDDVPSLLNLSHTSRILYALTSDEENWKRIYVANIDKYDELSWLGSWRNSVLRIPIQHNANLQLLNNLLCCDEIYRPYQCSQVDYKHIFRKVIQEEEMYHQDSLRGELGTLPSGRIQRINEADLGLDEFNSIYHDIPFILTNPDTARWPHWTFESLLNRFPQVKFRQEAVNWNLEKYSQYLQCNHDENPLYLFDCNSEAMKTLKKEYNPPKIFHQDYFKVFDDENLGFNCRPDHAWLIMGSARSGSTFHKDPNSTSAWNVAIQGRKLWVMIPPGIQPPGVSTDDEESEVTSPVGIAEWVISGFYNDVFKINCGGDSVSAAAANTIPQVGITFPGECMYVPAGWWHLVINIDDSIAITQNFVPQSKIPHVLNFFKNKPKQISGFRLKDVKKCLESIVRENYNRNRNNDDDGDDDASVVDAALVDCLDKFDELGTRIDDLDEDCGELANLPKFPIFEIFIHLLKRKGHQDLVNEALEKVKKWEEKAYQEETGRSRKWEHLTEVVPENSTTNGGAFAFGFDESDIE